MEAQEILERLRLSRERLMASELARSGQAWRLWAACVAATADGAYEESRIYLTVLIRASGGVHRNAAATLMARFDELGVFVWKAGHRGSGGKQVASQLALPPLHALPTVHGEPSSNLNHALPTVHGNAYMSKSLSQVGNTNTGADVSEDWNAEKTGPPEEQRARLCPTCGGPSNTLYECGSCLKAATDERLAEYERDERLSVVDRFGEPPPSAVTDTESYRMRHRKSR